MMGRVAKLLVSLAVRGWDWSCGRVRSCLGCPPPGTCVVLYYHAINRDERTRFARQMDHLLRQATPLPVDFRGHLEKGRHYAAVTFDDGYVSVVENALPELRARAIPAAIFVPTGSLGKPPGWIRNPAANGHGQTVMSEQQLAGLSNDPLVRIGSHTVNHPDLLGLPEQVALAEMRDSRRHLEGILGCRVRSFSFPHGAHDERLVALARTAGYERVFNISPRLAFAHPDEFNTGRVLAHPRDWPLEFRLKLSGAYRWLAPASRLKRRWTGGRK